MQLFGTMEIDQKGILKIGGISSIELVKEFGTPLLVLDEEEIRRNARKYKRAFIEHYPETKIVYAGKAFINRTLLKIIAEEGLGLDVVSGGELYTALQADFPVEKIYFHGNNKSLAEIKMAVEAGIGYFMVDNLQEARVINSLANDGDEKVKIILRVTPGIEAHTHEFIQTGQIDSKFGVSIYREQALEVIREILKLKNLNLIGIHAHIGSQIFNLTSFAREIDVMLDFMNQVKVKLDYYLEELDLGGGLGIAYTSEDERPDINHYARLIWEKLKEKAYSISYKLPQIIVEPGRSIIATAGTTLYTIGSIKEIPAVRKYLAVDGGMTDNIRPALYGAEYEAVLANKANRKEGELVTIAGKCCESGDILIHDINLPVAESGDILAISCTGAYTYAMSNNYNSLPRPAIVLVKGGQADLIIQRESYEDLLKNDVIPERFF